MYPDFKDRDDTAEYALALHGPDLIWAVPAGLCALGYYGFDLRGWMLVLFTAMSIAATGCFSFYFFASHRERRAKSRKKERAS